MTSQLGFLIGHEIGHKMDQSDSQKVAELRADCFGFVNTSLSGPFDAGMFSTLVSANPNAPADTKVLLEERALGLEKLGKYFVKHQLPRGGEETRDLCARLVGDGSKFRVGNGEPLDH